MSNDKTEIEPKALQHGQKLVGLRGILERMDGENLSGLEIYVMEKAIELYMRGGDQSGDQLLYLACSTLAYEKPDIYKNEPNDGKVAVRDAIQSLVAKGILWFKPEETAPTPGGTPDFYIAAIIENRTELIRCLSRITPNSDIK